MRKIKFTKDFATFKTGDDHQCDGLVASQLVHKDKVAEYTDIEEREKAAKEAEAKAERDRKAAKKEFKDAQAKAEKERKARNLESRKKAARPQAIENLQSKFDKMIEEETSKIIKAEDKAEADAQAKAKKLSEQDKDLM